MGDEKKEEKLLQWHAAFFADLQIELADEADQEKHRADFSGAQHRRVQESYGFLEC